MRSGSVSYPSPTCHKLHLDSSSRRRALVVGAIHGKFEMFMRLLTLAEYDSAVDVAKAARPNCGRTCVVAKTTRQV
jgi:hypothetical protein